MWQVLILATLSLSVTAEFQPQVAFRCGKPSIFLALDPPQRGGWLRDDQQGCVDRLEDVLAFCKRVYPRMAKNLTGVVPSSDVIAIHNWCDFKAKKCEGRSHNTHLTRAFKCLTTGFVPEALLVPDRCSFGHVFSPAERTDCRTLGGWRSLAASECGAKQGAPSLHSMGVLTPCPGKGEDKEQGYAGVEFVCCPRDVEKAPQNEAYVVSVSKDHARSPKQHKVVGKRPEGKEEDAAGKEQQEFLAAELSLRKEEQKEEAVLASEFAEAMSQLASVRKDRHGEKDFARLREELIKRFKQKFGRAISDEVAKERLLDTEHQRKVHERLQRRLDEARRALAQTATAKDVELPSLWAALSSFLRLALTSQLRALHHFSRLLLTDPAEAARERPVLRDHFLRMQRAMATATSETGHQPAMEAELRRKAADFTKSFGDLKASMRALLDASERVSADGAAESALEREGKARLSYMLEPYLHAGQVPMTPRKSIIFADQDPNAIPRDVNLDLRAQLPRQTPLHKNMAAHHRAAIAPPLEPELAHEPLKLGGLIGGLVAGMALLLLLLVVVLAVRHRQERPHAGYVMSVVELEPADEAAERTCEERHLASMQINGYENPTYRFFDKQ